MGTKTEEALIELLQKAQEQNAELMARLEAAGPKVQTIADSLRAEVAALSDGISHRNRPSIDEENVIGCRSDLGLEVNGKLYSATFDANIQHGRVYRLDNYRGPEEIMRSALAAKDPGICPYKEDVMREPGSAVMSQKFNTWWYETFFKPDLQRFVGKPLPPHIRVEAERAAKSDVAAE